MIHLALAFLKLRTDPFWMESVDFGIGAAVLGEKREKQEKEKEQGEEEEEENNNNNNQEKGADGVDVMGVEPRLRWNLLRISQHPYMRYEGLSLGFNGLFLYTGSVMFCVEGCI